MTPTPKLRFIERDSYSRNGEHFTHPHKVRILQQWWEEKTLPDAFFPGKWIDVPLETEE
jgi:hypothetical protein